MATPKTLQVLIEASARAIRRRAMEVWEWLRDHNKLEDMARAVELGNYDRVVLELERAGAMMAEASQASFLRATQTAQAAVTRSTKIPFSFDATNREAVRFLERQRARLVREVVRGQRDAITRSLIEGTERGDNPLQQARRIRESIGLTENQISQVENYRRALEAGSVAALRRQLRDRRFDSQVRRAAANDEPLTEAQINRMVDRYRERRLIRRSEDIGRTEALRAVNAGEHATWEQARDDGDVGTSEVEREWVHYHRPGERSFHLSMNGQKRGLSEPFTSGLGNRLMYPGDPSAPAGETINCTCSVVVTFKSLGAARRRR